MNFQISRAETELAVAEQFNFYLKSQIRTTLDFLMAAFVLRLLLLVTAVMAVREKPFAETNGNFNPRFSESGTSNAYRAILSQYQVTATAMIILCL